MKYKYSFEEKKKYIGTAAACILIVIAGIVYMCNRSGIDNAGSGGFAVQAGADGVSNVRLDSSTGDDRVTSDDSVTADNSVNGDDSVIAGDSAAGDGVTSDSIYVHVCGAVKKPGLYELAGDSRVADVIEAAGGFTDKASKNYLNLATVVNDGQKIVVPSKSEVKNGLAAADGDETVKQQTPKAAAVNINTAGIEELMTIPGVGESKAESIIEYRQKNGGFTCKEDIMNITGIKEGVFSKISDYIVVN